MQLADEKEVYLFPAKQSFEIFSMYFEYYKRYTGKEHPILSVNQTMNLIAKFPFDGVNDLSPTDYNRLIPAYFETKFDGCDRNINHFCSGDIRQYRYWECLGID